MRGRPGGSTGSSDAARFLEKRTKPRIRTALNNVSIGTNNFTFRYKVWEEIWQSILYKRLGGKGSSKSRGFIVLLSLFSVQLLILGILFDTCPAGVYFTSVSPSQNPKSILLNNYDDAGHVINSRKLWDRIQWVVEVAMPRNEVDKITGVKNQDIFLYSGNVDLTKYQHKIYKNPHPDLP